jgi:ABC-type multidrug transport system fused ATPase/permease subunit
MLFNDSIMNNIRYARLTATDKEVHEACKASAVHDKIMSFPDGAPPFKPPHNSKSCTDKKFVGYNSKVGDRGV